MHYELLYIVPIKYTEEELKNVTAGISKFIEKAGGKITKDEDLGKKKLAYPIKGYRHGYYILNEMDMEPAGLKDLNKDLRQASEIMRYQIVKKSERQQPVRPARTFSEKTESEEISLPKEKVAETEPKRAEKKEPEETKRMSMEDLDKKLDEILEIDET